MTISSREQKLNSRLHFLLLQIFSVFGLSGTQPVWAVPLPVFSTFDTDTIGQTPSLGGLNQPSSIFLQGSNSPSVLVGANANGISSQSIDAEFVDSSMGITNVAMAVYSFSTVNDGILRIESTVSLNQVENVDIAQTVNSTNAVVLRVTANALGQLEIGAVPIGLYSPDTPVRFRLDVNLDSFSWQATVDSELDGFSDNPTITGNQFTNDFTNGLPFNVASAYFGALEGTTPPTGLTYLVAQDNIAIDAIPSSTPIPEPNTLILLIGGLLPIRLWLSATNKANKRRTLAGCCRADHYL
jgi:hypothetical protein